MWDTALVFRVRNRKTEEAEMYGRMAENAADGCDVFSGIVSMLRDDIRLCDALIHGSDLPLPSLVPMHPDYLSGLAPADSADEQAFMNLKERLNRDASNSVAAIIDRAVDEIMGCAAGPLPSDNGGFADAFRLMLSALVKARMHIARLEALLAEAGVDIPDDGVNTTFSDDATPIADDNTNCESDSDDIEFVEPQLEEVESDAMMRPKGLPIDVILTDNEAWYISRVMELKDRKVDEYIDKSLAGSIRDDVCDDIVTFLKVDRDICRTLLDIDDTDMDSIVSGFRHILDVLEDAPEARYQKIYLSGLNREERILEDRYMDVMDKVHGLITSRYMRFI